MTSNPCNICESRDLKVFLVAADQIDTDCKQRLKLLRCKNCGLVFLQNRPGPSRAEEFTADVYSGLIHHPYFHDETAVSEKCRLRIGWLGSPQPGSKRLLDVGAGAGHLVHAAQQSGWEAYGIEPDLAAVNRTKERFDVNLTRGVLKADTYTADSFDVVTMWDVIEHVDDPKSLLQCAFEILRPGGRLVLRTANIDSWEFASHPKEWGMLFSGHLFYFSFRTITRLLNDVGFRQIEIRNFEPIEKPLAESSPVCTGLEATSWGDGATAILRNPLKLMRAPRAIMRKLRFRRFRTRHPDSYDVGIMIVDCRKLPVAVAETSVEEAEFGS